MSFAYRGGALCAEQVSLEDIARRFGTPCYVYSRAAIERNFGEYASALAGRPALIAYSVKANGNLALLGLLAKLGAGFDIVSGGELARVLAAGGDVRKVVFSGIGKSEAEIEQALKAQILCLNLESEAELDRVSAVAARLGATAPVAFRVNPDIDAKTHPHISTGLKQNKFGIDYADAPRLYREAAKRPAIKVIGIGCHIGSMMADPAPYAAAAARLAMLATQLEAAGIALSHLDLGGGIGIRSGQKTPATISEFIGGALAALGGRREKVIVDPGRSIIAEAGVLVTRIEYVKPGEAKNFAIVDAAMNDLIRPALYDAWHEVLPVRAPAESGAPQRVYDIVGPVCESADFLARERPLSVTAGDLLSIMSAGAYGMVMSSNYNARPRPAEVLVDGQQASLVRERETVEQLFAAERLLN